MDALPAASLSPDPRAFPDHGPASSINIFAGFASAADLFFRFVYECVIVSDCFSVGFDEPSRFSIDLHRILEIVVDVDFLYDFKDRLHRDQARRCCLAWALGQLA